MDENRKNWAGNYEYRARRLHVPKAVEEVQEIVRRCRRVKAIGTRHSFNGIADCTEDQISLRNFQQMELDRNASKVTIGAGVTYGDLAPYLYRSGYALHNLASLPHISLAGAAVTSTHGSGIRNGVLGTVVSEIEFVAANGELRRLSREQDGERFRGAVVNLGGLGIITQITLEVQPAFEMTQVVYKNLPFGELEDHLEEILSSGYSVSLFTDWRNQRATQVWIKSRAEHHFDAWPEFFGAKLAAVKLHPLPGCSPEHCTEQLGIPGPWYERLPHFRMNFIPSSGEELQSEYFVTRERAYEAILAVEKLAGRITPHLQITELRTVDADDLWMSPCYRRASVTIHFTWKADWLAVSRLLPAIEAELEPFEARPHWAKLFTMAPSRLQSLYVRLPAFQDLLASYDPDGKFRNEYLDKYILDAA